MWLRPAISWSASSIATSSNTCVAPPVGSGRAETPSSRMNSSAKLFSSNSSMMLPRVLSPSLCSQRSSSSLAVGPASGGRKVRLGTWKHVRKLAARVDVELAEHLPKMPLHCARAEEQARAYFRIRKALGSEPCDLQLLRSQVVARLSAALAHLLSGGEQLVARALGEQVHADAREQLVRGAQLRACVDAPVCAAQPFAVEQVRPRQLRTKPRPPQPLDRLRVESLGRVPIAQQRPRTCLHPAAPVVGAHVVACGEAVD